MIRIEFLEDWDTSQDPTGPAEVLGSWQSSEIDIFGFVAPTDLNPLLKKPRKGNVIRSQRNLGLPGFKCRRRFSEILGQFGWITASHGLGSPKKVRFLHFFDPIWAYPVKWSFVEWLTIFKRIHEDWMPEPSKIMFDFWTFRLEGKALDLACNAPKKKT